MKRFIRGILCVGMCACVLAGCAKEQDTEPEVDNPEKITTEYEAAPMTQADIQIVYEGVKIDYRSEQADNDQFPENEAQVQDEMVVQEKTQEQDDSFMCSVVPVEAELEPLILENPIDQELQWIDDGSMNRIEFAVSYKEAWEGEIAYAMEILQAYLSEADYAELEASYLAWTQYLESTMQVEISLFYVGSEYQREDTGLITGDGMTYPRVMEVAAQRTKEYAIELLSLEYALTGRIEFVFGKELR